MERRIIKIEELEKWIEDKKDFLMVDLMNPEYFAEKHIAGSINAPVYEVVFLTYFEKNNISKDKTIVVYNEDEKSLATEDAAMKLLAAGFDDVHEFPGGLSIWEKAGKEIERGDDVSVPSIVDGEYSLDSENSIVGWTGRNIKYAHNGKISVKSGNIVVKNEKVVAGNIILDMTTISDEDLKDEMWKGVLEAHLKSTDFFNTEKFPEASFEFSSADNFANALNGTPNYALRGNLSIKDVAREIEFPAMISIAGNNIINGQAHFDFDRTLWNVRYGSEKFFEKLGMHLVNDIVSLEIFLVAKK